MTEETPPVVAIADEKVGRSPKPKSTTKVEAPPEIFDYVKQGIYQVCQACQEPVQTGLNGKKICPVKNKNCPRNGDK